jgi:hypothetical protein
MPTFLARRRASSEVLLRGFRPWLIELCPSGRRWGRSRLHARWPDESSCPRNTARSRTGRTSRASARHASLGARTPRARDKAYQSVELTPGPKRFRQSASLGAQPIDTRTEEPNHRKHRAHGLLRLIAERASRVSTGGYQVDGPIPLRTRPASAERSWSALDRGVDQRGGTSCTSSTPSRASMETCRTVNAGEAASRPPGGAGSTWSGLACGGPSMEAKRCSACGDLPERRLRRLLVLSHASRAGAATSN